MEKEKSQPEFYIKQKYARVNMQEWSIFRKKETKKTPRQQDYTTSEDNRSYLGWREIAPDRNSEIQEGMKNIWNSSYGGDSTCTQNPILGMTFCSCC